MPDGKMPVYENGGRLMGHVLWTGTSSSGKWSFKASGSLNEIEQQRVKRQVTEISQSRRDLEDIRYRTASGSMQKGWHGFVGVLGAFRAALPAVGLLVERSEVEWPKVEDYKGPLGIDTEEQERQDEEERGYRETQMEIELVATRKAGENN